MKTNLWAAILTLPLLACGSAGLSPEPGYVWVDTRANDDFRQRWVPGMAYGEHGVVTRPHIVSAPQVGQWHPEDGYEWINPGNNNDLTVRWKPGVNHSRFPHVRSGKEEGKWYADEGYEWLDPARGDVHQVRWVPDRQHSSWPHVHTSYTEGSWLPDQGYHWVNRDRDGRPVNGDWRVQWIAGVGWRDYKGKVFPEAHIHAAPQEGQWQTDPGYVWRHPGRQGSLSVMTVEAMQLQGALLARWSRYLEEIESERDYSNWEGPPRSALNARKKS